MFVSGETVYFKMPGMPRTRKGIIIGGDAATGWQVQARRLMTQTAAQADVFTVPAEYLKSEADHKAAQEPTGIYETTSTNGRQITATELNRRATVAAERIQLTEAQIFQARAMLEIRKKILVKAAYRGHISKTTQDFDYQELSSEYDIASLQAFRTSASKATVTELQLFSDYIRGATDTVGSIALTIFRTSKTAVVRYLKSRNDYYHHHDNISDHAWRLAA